MAFWGIAITYGPHINNMTVTPTGEIQALSALRTARALLPKASPAEATLIEALSKRYADPPKVDRRPLDAAYADAMREAWKRFPEDLDVGALTAEAVMNLHARDLWHRDGSGRRETYELIEILNTILRKDPAHPLALHLLVHTFEESPNPERAAGAADRLRDLAPGLQHLVHMPSHIDVRCGRWREAIIANEKAIAAGKVQMQTNHLVEQYTVPLLHSYHMQMLCLMMVGQRKRAIDTANEMVSFVERARTERFREMGDGYMAMRYEVLLRFGLWDALLSELPPRDDRPMTAGMWHYARGIALAAKNDASAGRAEHRSLLDALRRLPTGAKIRGTPAKLLLVIAGKMLDGELLYREGRREDSVTALREAARQEDELTYAEPPDWLVPVRHALGAALISAGRYKDAEEAYRSDLRRYPDNIWALSGLEYSLRKQGSAEEASIISARLDRLTACSDVRILSSCLCLRPADGSAKGKR
jgi:tetratricopeptide (TPR) repeat protein